MNLRILKFVINFHSVLEIHRDGEIQEKNRKLWAVTDFGKSEIQPDLNPTANPAANPAANLPKSTDSAQSQLTVTAQSLPCQKVSAKSSQILEKPKRQ